MKTYQTSSLSSSPPPTRHSRTLVVARTREENADWLEQQFRNESQLTMALYTVDDNSTTASYQVPANKGHEAMPYLTYIIDHYDELDDVTIFMHSHRFTWHNNDLLDSDAVELVKRLRTQKVVRDGYMVCKTLFQPRCQSRSANNLLTQNLRCHHEPGCPAHIQPTLHPTTSLSAADVLNTPEAEIMGQAWMSLFPSSPLPATLSQPCCAQFAASRSAIRNHPFSDYVAFRNWLLNTDLDDKLSGRVFEYLYQYILGDKNEYCPEESVCYCEGYGVCFEGGEKDYWEYLDLKEWRQQLIHEIVHGEMEGTIEDDKVMELEGQILGLEKEISRRWEEALARGSALAIDE